jgi:hypothetical protein
MVERENGDADRCETTQCASCSSHRSSRLGAWPPSLRLLGVHLATLAQPSATSPDFARLQPMRGLSQRFVVGASVAGLALALSSGCAGAAKPDIEAAKGFKKFPLYWLGERFEGWRLSAILGLDYNAPFISFIYGTCRPHGGDEPSCTPPLEVQVSAYCTPAGVETAESRTDRTIRGAPIERNADGAPIMLTRRAQIKVYFGDGADSQAPLRALRALRSLNRVPPIIASTGPIPAPAHGCPR